MMKRFGNRETHQRDRADLIQDKIYEESCGYQDDTFDGESSEQIKVAKQSSQFNNEQITHANTCKEHNTFSQQQCTKCIFFRQTIEDEHYNNVNERPQQS